MDQVGHQTLQTLNQFIKPQVLKKVTYFLPSSFFMVSTHLLLSVSLFYFFFSYSPWPCPSFLLQFSNLYFSTFPLQLFNLTTDRRCIFFLCIGILVFLARNSSMIRSSLSGTENTSEEIFKNKAGDSPSESLTSEIKASLLGKKLVVESTGAIENVVVGKRRENEYLVEEQEVDSTKSIEGNEQKAESELLIRGGGGGGETGLVILEDGKEEKESESGFSEEEEEEEGGEEEEEEERDDQLLSAEELKMKFDDFITGVKEEIRKKMGRFISASSIKE